jgi:hypothetical protein
MPKKSTTPPPLDVLIKQHILLLNNELPPTVASIWVTSDELHQRLIHSGVRKSLTLEMVQGSLRRNNSNMMHLNVHHQDGMKFYRSAAVTNNDLPLGQRKNLKSQKWNRVNYCPRENYFMTSSSSNLAIINTALKELEDSASQLEVTPVKTSNAETQTEPLAETPTKPSAAHFLCQEVDNYDGICFMSVKRMDSFICEIASHASQCGMASVLVERKTHYCGTMLYERWRCPCCGEDLTFTNQELVKTDEVAVGAKFSRQQPLQQSQQAKDRRTICKMTRAHKMGKTESAQCHKSNKVPLDEDAKSLVVKDSTKSTVKKLSTCGNCKQLGHTRTQCFMPPNSKRSRAVLVDFDDFDGECRPSKRKKKGPDLIAVDDWII